MTVMSLYWANNLGVVSVLQSSTTITSALQLHCVIADLIARSTVLSLLYDVIITDIVGVINKSCQLK